VARISTDAANDIGSEVLLLGAVVFPVTNLTTVLAGLILVIPESTVQRRKFTELVSLEFVLALGNRGSLGEVEHFIAKGDQMISLTYCLDNIMDQFLGFIDLFLGICHDQAVEILFLVACVCSIGPAFTFLDRTFSTDGNLGTGFSFHLLQSVATRANK
jgi:hypothetical protein